MAAAQQEQELPDPLLYEILVRLPPEDFHRCRCLSRFWAATLSSHDAIDHHLRLRGKIRLHYDDVMTSLVLDCCDCDYVDDDDTIHGAAGAEEEEEGLADWRQEYRRKGYVEVDEDFYEGRGEMSEEMAKLGWSEITPAADSGIYTVQYGALHPRIREPFLMQAEQQHHDDDDDIVVVKFVEKTEEEVDREIVAFLCKCRRMDPPALLLQQLHTFEYCPPPHHQQRQQEVGFQDDDDDHQDDYSSYSDDEDADGLFESNDACTSS